jgi:hypothetical protein
MSMALILPSVCNRLQTIAAPALARNICIPREHIVTVRRRPAAPVVRGSVPCYYATVWCDDAVPGQPWADNGPRATGRPARARQQREAEQKAGTFWRQIRNGYSTLDMSQVLKLAYRANEAPGSVALEFQSTARPEALQSLWIRKTDVQKLNCMSAG